jgi:hypothetical protein
VTTTLTWPSGGRSTDITGRVEVSAETDLVGWVELAEGAKLMGPTVLDVVAAFAESVDEAGEVKDF